MQEVVAIGEPKPIAKSAKRKKEIDISPPDGGEVSAKSLVAGTEQAAAPAHDAIETEMMTLGAVCVFFGGDRPLNPSTLYRGVRAGQYPPPVLLGPNNPRWLRKECRQALERLVKERNKYSSSRWLRQTEPEAA